MFWGWGTVPLEFLGAWIWLRRLEDISSLAVCLSFVWKRSAAVLKLLPVLVDGLAGMELIEKGQDHIRGREANTEGTVGWW